MIALAKIELTRAEGPIENCGKAMPVDSWAAADGQLTRWAHTAPEPGQGYDKVDFKVTWADGETYEGRYDMNRLGEDSETNGHDLARHIRRFLNWIAHCPECPGSARGLQRHGEPAKAKEFIANYLPPDSPMSPTPTTFSCCRRTR